MLVLVLILVVIALVLLLAGWFLQVVALAWTSVGISLLAGLVLLYDWWQTRSAVRAGDRSEGVGTDARRGDAMEPATQVLPVVQPASAAGSGAAGGAGNASDATVQMPVVRPSGSPEGPSGESLSSGSSSPSVTGSGGPAPTGATDGPPDGTGRGGDPDRSGGPSVPDTSGPDAGTAPAAGSPGAVPQEPQATAGRDDHGPGEPATVAAPAASADDGAATPEAPGDGYQDAEPAGSDGAAATGGGPDGEAPEEQHDPTLAALVARLPDEVLVIDEHPRYHVPACRTLSGRAVIPLPVSEAVELGFTPCAWCSPNRALGERHPAQVR